jgi:NAD(P)-dependent dehydrogenase (short-subunit alcohol dehydrogenase family)
VILVKFNQFTAGISGVKNFAGRIAVVTGAGSGIGRATAVALAEEGATVAVTDVNPQSAGETVSIISDRGHEAHAFTLDVSDPGQIVQVAQQLQECMGVPAVLVNNAGIAVGGYFLDMSPETWQRIIAINLMGVIHCSRAFIPAMVASGQAGHVVNISSMLGYTQARGVSAYCTTKFGVLGFSESLRAELVDHGIGVSAICPGMIRTNIINSGVLESPDADIEEKRKTIDAMYEKRNYPPEKVAQAIISAIRRNRAVVPVAPEAWAAYYARRWVPWLVRWQARKDIV